MHFPGTAFVTLVTSFITSALADCNYLGTRPASNSSIKFSCVCNPGWVGDNCQYLNFARIANTPAAYYNGSVPDAWGGRCIKVKDNGDTIEYCLVTTFLDGVGVIGFAYTSTIALWRSVNDRNFELLSYVGDKDGPGNILWWRHNAEMVLNCKPNGVCAVVIYAIAKRTIAGKQMGKAAFSTPNYLVRAQWAGAFSSQPQAYSQFSIIAGVEVGNKNSAQLPKQLGALFAKGQNQSNVNNAGVTLRINQEFTFSDLSAKLKGAPANTINPNPLRNTFDDATAWVKGRDGKLYGVFFGRTSNEGSEKIGIWFWPADQYPWEVAVFNKSHTISFNGDNVEDQACFIDAQAVHCLVHSTKACGRSNRLHCVAITHFPLNNSQGKHLLDPDAASVWTVPMRITQGVMPDYVNKPLAFQRAWLSHQNNSAKCLRAGAAFNLHLRKTAKGLVMANGRPSSNVRLQIV